MSAKKEEDDLVDAGSEYSFPASDPPSYMGGALIAGPPPTTPRCRGNPRAMSSAIPTRQSRPG
jgi:hypothetical protein